MMIGIIALDAAQRWPPMSDSEFSDRKTVMSILDRIDLFREQLPRKCLYCQHGYPADYESEDRGMVGNDD